MALCSLSTGIILTLFFFASENMNCPPSTTVSLFASAMSMPRSMRIFEKKSPSEPLTAFNAISASMEDRNDMISSLLLPSVRRYGHLKYDASSAMDVDFLATRARMSKSRCFSFMHLIAVCPIEPLEPNMIILLIASRRLSSLLKTEQQRTTDYLSCLGSHHGRGL